MDRRGRYLLVLGAAVTAAGVAAVRHRPGAVTAPPSGGGILIGDVGAYDRLTRLVFAVFYRGVAADVAQGTPRAGRVLDIGCGPGHLALILARDHQLDVTGVDLDPAMIRRARANAGRALDGDPHRPTFLVGDAASLGLPDASFDVVVSTLAMHHWADPTAGLTEIGRVLRPGGRALVWDVRPGSARLHPHAPDPVGHARGTGLQVVDVAPWRWPWRFALTQRVELVRV